MATSADKIRKLFDVIKNSQRGSNEYAKETAMFMFVDFLENLVVLFYNKLHDGIYSCIRTTAKIDGEPGEVTLGLVLNFFTGYDAVLLCGYANPSEVNFLVPAT